MLPEEPSFPFQSKSRAPELWCVRVAPCFHTSAAGTETWLNRALLLRSGCYTAWPRGNENQMWNRLTNTAVLSWLPLQHQGFPDNHLNQCPSHALPLLSQLQPSTPGVLASKHLCVWSISTQPSHAHGNSAKRLTAHVVAGSLFLLVWNPAPSFSDLINIMVQLWDNYAQEKITYLQNKV